MQNKKHLIIISVLILFLSVLVYYGLVASNLFPAQAAAQAIPIDWLFDLELKLICFFLFGDHGFRWSIHWSFSERYV